MGIWGKKDWYIYICIYIYTYIYVYIYISKDIVSIFGTMWWHPTINQSTLLCECCECNDLKASKVYSLHNTLNTLLHRLVTKCFLCTILRVSADVHHHLLSVYISMFALKSNPAVSLFSFGEATSGSWQRFNAAECHCNEPSNVKYAF